jgi:8-oxo-dGTP pyrophosphatase MutT (NUDIX family)
MNSLPNQRFHVVVYGVLINENRVLLIKKSRGAYKGMFDLPGGSIEFGEKVEEALKREFIEETEVILKDYDFIGHNEYFCDYLNESNEPRQLHHLGLYYHVSASFDKIKTDADGQDSLGAQFMDIEDLDKIKISPIARPMIEKVINNIKYL